MSYNGDGQEDRRGNKESHDNNQHRDNRDKSSNRSSEFRKDDGFAEHLVENENGLQHYNVKVRYNEENDRHKRNPNWDENAPYSSTYTLDDYLTGRNETHNERDLEFEARERERFLNRYHSTHRMTDSGRFAD